MFDRADRYEVAYLSINFLQRYFWRVVRTDVVVLHTIGQTRVTYVLRETRRAICVTLTLSQFWGRRANLTGHI